MENWETFVTNLLKRSGFDDWGVEVDSENRKGKIYIRDHHTLVKENLPFLVKNFNHLIQQIAKKNNQPPIFFDINNYRREREILLTELARAAARKAASTSQEISLPAMNSYERRIVHVELATHPVITTESRGAGRGRYVVIRPLKEGESQGVARGQDALPREEAGPTDSAEDSL